MYRKIVSKLVKRKETSNKALMVTDARQVGKTYIIREFLKTKLVKTILLNSMKTGER